MITQANDTTLVGTKSTEAKLLNELENAKGMARRQELMKAIWRLDRQAVSHLPPIPLQLSPVVTVEAKSHSRDSRILRQQDDHSQARSKAIAPAATAHIAENRSPSVLNEQKSFATLNQLYRIEKFSLPNYLRYAKPREPATGECLREAIWHIADEQLAVSNRVGSLIVERRGPIEAGSFPFRFTAFNDLSLDYLALRAVEEQERIIQEVTDLARRLRFDPVAQNVALEILGSERAHLEILHEVIDGQECGLNHAPVVVGVSERRCRGHTVVGSTAA